MPRVRKSAAAPVGVISKVLRILETIQRSHSGLGLKAISDLTGIHKSTAHRFLKHLEGENYLIATGDGAYLIGPRFWQMVARVNHHAALQAVARPVLWELWKSTQETVNLAVLDQATVLYIDVMESPHEFRLASRIGSRRELYATGLGKALTAFLPEEEKKNILNTITFHASTPKTIMNPVQFRQELEKICRQGYAVDDEEAVTGARCVSAPILVAEGLPIAAISVSGPVTRVTPSRVEALAEAVTAAARAISVEVGFSPQQAESASPQHQEKTRAARKHIGGSTLSKAHKRKKLTLVCAASIVLFFAAIRPIFAQAPAPPASKPTMVPQIGGNSFVGPKDIIYLPNNPVSDTRADMFFGDWRKSEPKVMWGSLIVRDILTQGDNLSPPFPGAVLEHAEFLSYGQLEPGARTIPSTLAGMQVFFYVSDGEGEVSTTDGRTAPLHKGSALLVPEGLEFTLRNTGTTQLTAYIVGDPTYSGFKPLTSFALKDEDTIRNGPHHPPTPSPFTNPGATAHWAHIEANFFSRKNGLATVGAISTVEILPMQLGEPHPHFPGHEEIWCAVQGTSLAFYGSQLRLQRPGQAFMLRPDNLTTHSNINFEEPGDKPINFLWFAN